MNIDWDLLVAGITVVLIGIMCAFCICMAVLNKKGDKT